MQGCGADDFGVGGALARERSTVIIANAAGVDVARAFKRLLLLIRSCLSMQVATVAYETTSRLHDLKWPRRLRQAVVLAAKPHPLLQRVLMQLQAMLQHPPQAFASPANEPHSMQSRTQ